MDVHPSLTRSFTDAPSSSHTRLESNSSNHHKSHNTNSSYSVSTSRASNSTQHTSASALWSLNSNAASQGTIAPLPNGTVSASNNVINRVADKSTSLFQLCRTLRNRLLAVPGFDEDLLWTESHDEETLADPVALLWKTFRRGDPLLRILNMLRPHDPMVVDYDKYPGGQKREKLASFKFLTAVMNDLHFHQDDCFIIGDLFGEDTTGFVKVVRVVSRVVDIIEGRGLIKPYREEAALTGNLGKKRTQRQHIVAELVQTEHTYVQHLETLHGFKLHVEQKSIITGDAVHDIFLNLNALLDFQRRFLIAVEQIDYSPEEKQDWGQLFINNGAGLRVYESYIANQRTCEEVAMRNYDKLRDAGAGSELQQIVESPTHLTAFLLKPFQRLAKYPLLLKELRDKGQLDELRRQHCTDAIAIIQSILRDTNAYIASQERAEAVKELLAAVVDWKNHHYDGFGELLQYGAFLIQKGDITQSDVEVRQIEYKLYLFENMLLCCKDVTHKRNRLVPGNNSALPPGPAGRKVKPRYTLKGRIFLFNLEDVITMVKQGESYMLKLSWLANPGVESLAVRFPSEETMNLWKDTLLERKMLCKMEQRKLEQDRQLLQDKLRARSSSQFNYLADHGDQDNPYKQVEEDEEGTVSRFGSKESLIQSISAQGSSNSLRSRSTTGESGPPIIGRALPMKYPAGFSGAPLTVRTHQLHNNASPMDKGNNNSYFSPTADSPISSRTSSSSGMIPFPRQATPSNGWPQEDSNRFTAPAQSTRAHPNGYGNSEQRNARGQPSQAMPMHPASLAHNRMRSASSPDVHARPSHGSAPPVPVMPQHLAGQGAVSRSQSPAYVNGNGSRTTTSPNAKVRQGSQLRDYTSVDAANEYDAYHNHNNRSSAQTQGSAEIFSPSMSSGEPMSGDRSNILSFKIKVFVPSESTTFTLVAGSTISYRALRDRIDAKLLRCTNITMAAGNLRLQFVEDGEMYSIQTDEDVQTAFDVWRESHLHRDSVISSQLGEIEIHCTRMGS